MKPIVTRVTPWTFSTVEEALANPGPEPRKYVWWLIREWEERGRSWLDFRLAIRRIAEKYNRVPPDDGESEWVAPCDDDDILLDIPPWLFDAEPEVALVAWPVCVLRFIPPIGAHISVPNHVSGPQSNGYAVRRSFLDRVTERQRGFLLKDHANAHRYIHYSGKEYRMFRSPILGYAARTPASMTFAHERAKNNARWPTAEEILKGLPEDAHPYRREIAEAVLHVL